MRKLMMLAFVMLCCKGFGQTNYHGLYGRKIVDFKMSENWTDSKIKVFEMGNQKEKVYYTFEKWADEYDVMRDTTLRGGVFFKCAENNTQIFVYKYDNFCRKKPSSNPFGFYDREGVNFFLVVRADL